MHPVNSVTRRGSRAINFPGWFFRRKSGIVLVGPGFPKTLPDDLFGRMLKDRRQPETRRMANGPVVLELYPPTPDPAAKGHDQPRPVGTSPVWTVSPAQVIDLLRRGDIDLSGLETIVTHVPPRDTLSFSADVGFILSKSEQLPQVILICEHEPSPDVMERIPVRRWRRSDLRRTSVLQQEGSNTMARSGDRYIDDPNGLKEKVAELVRRIHEEEDPHEMNEYKKFIKKNVSIFSRSYFTAYLVKQFVDGNTERRPRKTRSKKEEPVIGNVAPEDRQTLFVSVGKNRRVYPKDFVALFAELDGVDGDDIGQIKILDNYSFVEVEQTVADKIIAAYDGFDFRGRKLTVNFARTKKD